jgi:predicted nucleotide-binding protein (sugar kinase/HSP70/actin superfamily)
MSNNNEKKLEGCTLYIHPMTRGGASLIAATFRSFDIDARIVPPSNARTLEIGNLYSSGEECLPEKITIGDYLRVVEEEGFDPKKTAFLMPTANGPCRFGQYSHFLESILKKNGLEDIMIVSPSSQNGYLGVGGGNRNTFFRSVWIGLIASDILRKMLLKTRPYEKVRGTTDGVYQRGLKRVEAILEDKNIRYRNRFNLLRDALVVSRDEFRSIDAAYTRDKPLIGVIGEIFCRHNSFANVDIIRKFEDYGAEAWIADVGEWISYTDWSRMDNMKRQGRGFSPAMARSILKKHIMVKDEHSLLKPFHDDFVGYEEPADTQVLVDYGKPYLPADGALGEMALSLGRACYLHGKGIDGIIDISPLFCMNGIVSEAVYPSFSRDYDAIPSRVFYFDGINVDLDRDIGIFMELVFGYKSRKKQTRKYPAVFG